MASSVQLPRKDGKLDARWWLIEKPKKIEDNDVHLYVTAVVKFLRDRQSLRRKYDLLHARLYGNLRMQGFGISTYSQADGIEDDRITLNLIKNMTEAVTSRITQNLPKVTFTTSGESWTQQNRSKLLEQFTEGQMHRTEFGDKATMAFRSACIYGTGILKMYDADGEIRAEEVKPWMLTVDDAEAMEGKPRNLYEHRYVDKEILVELYANGDKDRAELIRECTLSSDEDGYGRDITADQLLLTEAWHLPAAKGSPGRHVICIGNCTLLDEEWDLDRFPHIIIRWTPAPAGYFGIGLAAELFGLHVEVQKLLRQIQQAHHLCGWPRIYVQRGSKIVKQHLTNEIGTIVEYDTVKPDQAAFPVVPSEIYGHLKFLIEQAYQIVGISQMAATSQKPPGVESGVALMNLQDVQTVRFAAVETIWSKLFTDAAYMFVWLAEKIGKERKDYYVSAIDRGYMTKIPWADARLAMDEFVIQTWATGSMPSTPAGKIEYLEKIAQMGELDPLELMARLRDPDVDAIVKQKTAPRDYINKSLEKMIRNGKVISPEPNDDLEYGVKRANQEYNRLRLLDDVPAKALETIDVYIQQASKLLGWAAQPPEDVPPGADPMMAADPMAGGPAPEMLSPDMMAPPPAEGGPLPPEMAPPPMDPSLDPMAMPPAPPPM
jgi:hypothetical protein